MGLAPVNMTGRWQFAQPMVVNSFAPFLAESVKAGTGRGAKNLMKSVKRSIPALPVAGSIWSSGSSTVSHLSNRLVFPFGAFSWGNSRLVIPISFR